ncbi:MAG: T9SS type A sorting domain-containing protein, partial [Ignavibacteriaceae bacterium]|nr:T9SS type A sorting domain-containing protein [Ignavibacteriaceae bacterium]
MKRSVTIAVALSLSFLTGWTIWNYSNTPKGEDEGTQKPKSVLYQEKFGAAVNYTGSQIFSENGITNVRINSTSGVSEPKIAVNPTDANNFVAVSNDFSLSGNKARVFCSNDGGLNWTARVIALSGLNGFDDATDPAITFDADGNSYYAAIHYQVFGSGDGVFVNKSVDKGATWKAAATEVKRNNDALLFEDRPAIAADMSELATRNNIYIAWTSVNNNSNSILFSYSTDGAQSFSNPIELAAGNVNTAEVKVDMQGNVFVAYLKNNNTIIVTKSVDAGNSFTTSVTAASFEHAGEFVTNAYLLKKNTNGSGVRVRSYPVIAVDNKTNKLYLAYTAKSGSDFADIFLTESVDFGTTWSTPVRVNDDRTTNDQFMPALAVDGNSMVYVMWQDSRSDAQNLMTDTYIASFNDGNIINQKVSSGSFNPSAILLGNYIGDYNGLATNGNIVVPIWTDGRSSNFDVFVGLVNNSTTSVSDKTMPVQFNVSQNYPNPFNPSTIISFSIPAEGFVNIKLYDVLGKEVVTLFNGNTTSGNHTVVFDAASNNLSSGTYIYSVNYNGNTISKKMVLTK